MIHPLFITMAKEPGLFLEHADAYADLAMAELDCWRSRLKQRATLTFTAVLFDLPKRSRRGLSAMV